MHKVTSFAEELSNKLFYFFRIPGTGVALNKHSADMTLQKKTSFYFREAT